MYTEEYLLTPHPNTKYLPLSNGGKSNDQPPSRRSAWCIAFQKYAPFCVHFGLTAFVATVCLCFLDGRSFNVNSRKPQYHEADGSLSRVASYAPLQSDVTTAVSVAATATRVAGGLWAAGYIWRGIFMSMEGGGISLEGLSQAISNRPPAPRHFTRRSNMIIIYITLVTTFAIDYFSAVLSGSFIWEASNGLVPGNVPLSGIGRGVNGTSLTSGGYLIYPDLQTAVVSAGSAAANLAWVELHSNSTSNITAPSTTFRHVIKEARYLNPNSTLENVTVPFFIVDAFEWVQDPDLVLTEQQSALFADYTSFSPFFSGWGKGGLLPDSQWGPSSATPLNPHTVSETRFFAWRTARLGPNTTTGNDIPCPQNYTVDPGTQINLHVFHRPKVYNDCFAIANMTYRAGVAVCHACKVISPTVLKAEAPLSLYPDSFTSMALAAAPSLGTNLLFSGYAIPPKNYTTPKDFSIEFTSRSYQAAWTAFSDIFRDESDSTAVQIALPTLRAKIIPWRVYLWVGLHLWFLALGLLFMYVQRHYHHPWVENTTMAIFWLDTSAVIRSSGQCIDPWQPGTKICTDGMLVLEEANQASRSVKIKRI